jgi:hypothetical protein
MGAAAVSRDIREGYAGAQRAADHADRTSPLWSKVAYVRALEYVVRHGRGHMFTTIQLRAWCEERHVAPPPDKRAWGNITRKLAGKHTIADSGDRSPTGSHGRDVAVWEVL